MLSDSLILMRSRPERGSQLVDHDRRGAKKKEIKIFSREFRNGLAKLQLRKRHEFCRRTGYNPGGVQNFPLTAEEEESERSYWYSRDRTVEQLRAERREDGWPGPSGGISDLNNEF